MNSDRPLPLVNAQHLFRCNLGFIPLAEWFSLTFPCAERANQPF
jgi:hypothetical protein